MPLSIGDKLGPYEILAPIGAGGMGEVYKARDTGTRQNFDLAPDGKRVAFFPRPAEHQSQGSLHVTFPLNFFDELRRRVPTGRWS